MRQGMAASRIEPIIYYLRNAVLRQDGPGVSDGRLVEEFVNNRDAAGFESLVRCCSSHSCPFIAATCQRWIDMQMD
jgi:hypothetical protein